MAAGDYGSAVGAQLGAPLLRGRVGSHVSPLPEQGLPLPEQGLNETFGLAVGAAHIFDEGIAVERVEQHIQPLVGRIYLAHL